MRSAATIALERGYDPRQVVADGSVEGSGGVFYYRSRQAKERVTVREKGCSQPAKGGPLSTYGNKGHVYANANIFVNF